LILQRNCHGGRKNLNFSVEPGCSGVKAEHSESKQGEANHGRKSLIGDDGQTETCSWVAIVFLQGMWDHFYGLPIGER
jgi:hypothetical protein